MTFLQPFWCVSLWLIARIAPLLKQSWIIFVSNRQFILQNYPYFVKFHTSPLLPNDNAKRSIVFRGEIIWTGYLLFVCKSSKNYGVTYLTEVNLATKNQMEEESIFIPNNRVLGACISLFHILTGWDLEERGADICNWGRIVNCMSLIRSYKST